MANASVNIQLVVEPAVYEIEMGKRYVIRVEEPLSMERMKRLHEIINEWWESDAPFLLTDANIKLVKVEPETVD